MTNDAEEQAASKLIRALVQFHRLYHIGSGVRKVARESMGFGNDSSRPRFSEILLLFAIRNATRHNPDGVSATELSREMEVKPPTINPLLTNLERKKMIRRVTDANDRRFVRITLSEAGNNFTKMCEEKLADGIRGLIAYLGTEKSNELADLMNEVYLYFSKRKRHPCCPDAKEQ